MYLAKIIYENFIALLTILIFERTHLIVIPCNCSNPNNISLKKKKKEMKKETREWQNLKD